MQQSILRRILMNKPAILLLFAVLIGGSYQAHAQSEETFTDRVYLKNGDRLTGSIKELDRGKLRLKTETMDTVYLHWVDVESVESTTYLRIAVTDGTYRYGRMQKSAEEANIRIFGAGDSVEIPMHIISGMKPLRVDQTILQQLEGEITAGVDYRQDTDILLVNVGSKLRYREEKYELELGLNWNETQRGEAGSRHQVQAGECCQ
jgi:sRNA-binding regulator protein Hfq